MESLEGPTGPSLIPSHSFMELGDKVVLGMNVLIKHAKTLPHHKLAQIVVANKGDLGVVEEKALELGISSELFYVWLESTEGHAAIARIRKGFDELLDSALTRLLEIVYVEMFDRAKYGDWCRDRETGGVYRQPLRAQVLSNILEKIIDKRDLLRMSTKTISSVESGDSESLVKTIKSLGNNSSLLVRKRTSSEETVVVDGS